MSDAHHQFPLERISSTPTLPANLANVAKKPTILLVTGPLPTGACYDTLIPHLEQAGYEYSVAALPGAKSGQQDFDAAKHSAVSDGEYVLEEYLMPLLHEGKDIVVFAHSFGATFSGGADVAVKKRARQAKGEEGGVLGVACINFALVPEGQSQIEVMGGQWPDWAKLDTPEPGLLTLDPIIDILYNDAPASMHAQLLASHVPTAINVFKTPVLPPLWKDAAFDAAADGADGPRRTYIKPLLDHTFPPRF